MEEVAGAGGTAKEEEAEMLELAGDCSRGGAAEDEVVSVSDTEGKTEEVEATEEEEGPGGGLE